jgi:hypothetical protein
MANKKTPNVPSSAMLDSTGPLVVNWLSGVPGIYVFADKSKQDAKMTLLLAAEAKSP